MNIASGTATRYRCANRLCQAPLDSDHVAVITTRHLRRFCCVECIGQGQEADQDLTMAMVARELDRTLAHEEWVRMA